MPESPEDLYARVMRSADAEGRLPLPPVTEWDIFPWDVTATRPLLPPVDAERPRHGEGGVDCARCADPELDAIWTNDRWLVASTPEPHGMPLVLFVIPHEHLDFTDLGDDLAAELGRLSVRLARIMEGLPGIGRVHVEKIGDGAEHLHVWFIARPERLPQVVGSPVVDWDDILPPVPEDVWREDLAYVARHLATHGGRALV